MFYDENSIKEKFDEIRKVSGTLPPFEESMPTYMSGQNWTDEHREKHGYEKQKDGTWIKRIPVDVWIDVMEKDTLDLHRRNSENYNKLMVSNRRNYEMEYGLRVAEKSLRNALAMTKEMIDE
jgi:hypothetical protein